MDQRFVTSLSQCVHSILFHSHILYLLCDTGCLLPTLENLQNKYILSPAVPSDRKGSANLIHFRFSCPYILS